MPSLHPVWMGILYGGTSMILHFKKKSIEKSTAFNGCKVKQYTYFQYKNKTTFIVFLRLNLIPLDEVEDFNKIVKLYKNMALIRTTFTTKYGTLCKAMNELTE